jgi:hypothetical protein
MRLIVSAVPKTQIILIIYLIHFSHVPQPLQLLNVIAAVMMLLIALATFIVLMTMVWKVVTALIKFVIGAESF